MDAATVIEVTSSVSEVLVALAALGFALLMARQEAASRDRIEGWLEEALKRAAERDKMPPPKPDQN
jgi:hypothetical protein